jgi:putative hydrolase of the HAD superfamily
MQKDLDAVIFDFGGVLINIDYDATVESFRHMGIDNFDHLFSQAQQSMLFDKYETGQIDSEAFIDGISNYLPDGIKVSDTIDAWNSMIKDVPHENIELLLKLRSETDLKIYMLSNTNDIHIDLALARWNDTCTLSPFDIFDHVYLSQRLGLRKPSKEIFEHVIKEQNLDRSRTLFIDDSIQHIEGAEKVGLKTHHLTNMEELFQLFS